MQDKQFGQQGRVMRGEAGRGRPGRGQQAPFAAAGGRPDGRHGGGGKGGHGAGGPGAGMGGAGGGRGGMKAVAKGGMAGGGRGKAAARLFDHGDLRLVILSLLAEKPRYGYEIIKELEERVGGGYSPSPGVIYPTLTMLEDLGHATVSDEHGGRRQVTLSPEGHAFLEANQTAVQAILARIADRAGRGGPPPQVARAMENLAAALRLRLKGRECSIEQARAIAEAIDAAARAVEDV